MEKREGELIILIVVFWVDNSEAGKGKALIHRGQSQKPGLACSAEKRHRGRDQCLGGSSCLQDIVSRVRYCSREESDHSLYYFFRPNGVNSGVVKADGCY